MNTSITINSNEFAKLPDNVKMDENITWNIIISENDEDLYEPLLHDNERIALYPLNNINVWDYYKMHISTFWTATEVDLSADLHDWKFKLSSDERYYLEMILGFFAMSDFIVNENLATNFMQKVKLRELQMYYRFQMAIEDIHSTVYADMINNLVQDNTRKTELFNAVLTIPVVAKKAEWARKHIYDETKNEVEKFITRLLVFSVVEGIFFSGSFCSIFWVKKRGLMPGLTFSNELIARDEGLHRDVACYLYKNVIVNKFPEDKVIAIVKEGVELEKEFVRDALPVELIGMNSKLMTQYVEFVADHLLINLIGRKVYMTENPFPWMDMISLSSKSNFFEIKSSAYAKAENGDVKFDTDF